MGILGRMNAVHEVVGIHHRTHMSLAYSCFERGQVNLTKGPLVHVRTHVVAVVFLVVCGKVLHRRHYTLALHSVNVTNRSPGRQKRVFSEVLKVPSIHWRSIDVHSRAKQNMHSACPSIKTNRTPDSLRKLGVP